MNKHHQPEDKHDQKIDLHEENKQLTINTSSNASHQQAVDQNSKP